MRPLLLLLLVSLLVSDLTLLGDGDWVVDYCRSLCRKLPQMTPRGPEILQTQTELQCFLRNCVYIAVQHKQRTSPFYWAYTGHNDHGRSLSHQEFTRIIRRNHFPALVVSLLHGKGKSVPADTVAALDVISETSHIAMDIIKEHPDSESAWTLHHHTAASGHNFQAFLLEKSKSWAAANIVQLQKMLTKRYCAASTMIISCCFKEGEIRSAMNIRKISKEQIAKPQIRQTEGARRAKDIKVLWKYDGQAAVSQHEVFKADTLHSSRKTSDKSQLEIQRKSVRIIKQKSAQKQQPLKAASTVYDDDDDDDRFWVQKQLLLASREKIESISRPRYKIKATQDDNKEDFSGKIISKQAEFGRPEGESETEPSHTNTIANGNQRRLAYILRAAHKTDNNDVDHKQTLTEAGEEVLIMLFLPDTERETQTEPSSERKLILNTDTGWKTVNIHIKKPDDPPAMTKVIKENFIIELECLKASLFSLEMYEIDRTEGIDIKPAESTDKVTPVSVYTEEQVKGTEHTQTNNTAHENMGIYHPKQEEESVIASPPSVTMTETAKTERIAETTTVNMEIKETASSVEVFNQEADRLQSTETPRTTASPESAADAEPRFRKCKTVSIQGTNEKSFSGLRMRQDIPADTTETEGTDATNRPETERMEIQHDPNIDSFTSAKPSPTIHKQAADTDQKTSDDNKPLCRGLIHRTEAGWKHCTERSAGMKSNMFSSKEATDGFKYKGKQEKKHMPVRDQGDNLLNDDEYDHFYYFDGVLRRVQNHFYPHYKRQRRRKRSADNTENDVFTVRNKRDTQENLLSYIRRFILRKKNLK